jgi:hypothetical protein
MRRSFPNLFKKGDKMKRKLIVVGIMLVTLLVISGTAAAHPQNFGVHLSAVPGVETHGQGQAKFQLDHGELSFVLALSKLNGTATAAHIHISDEPGDSGPPVISLCGAFGPAPIPVEVCGGPGHPAKGSVSLDESQAEMLMNAIAEDRAYVNVHTTEHGAGEVRGRLQ